MNRYAFILDSFYFYTNEHESDTKLLQIEYESAELSNPEKFVEALYPRKFEPNISCNSFS